MDSSVWAGLPDELKAQAWTLVKAGWHLEANRILVEHLGDAMTAGAIVAFLVRRKLGIHN